MKYTSQDYLKKTLLDTQERVRDFMRFSHEMPDGELRRFFGRYAESEAEHATALHNFIEQSK